MPFDMKVTGSLPVSTQNSPIRSDEAVQAARKREGVVEAYELEANDDGYHCVIITEHPIPSEREEIEERLEKLEGEEREAYLDEKRAEAEAASEQLHKELQSLPSIVAGEGRRVEGDIRRDEPVHEIAWTPGHPGHGHDAHPAPADL